MMNRKMNVYSGSILLLMFCSLLLISVEIGAAQPELNPSLQPPPGNSLVLQARTQNGKQIYKCSTEKWMVIGATADLVMASNPSIRVGTYSSQKFDRHGRSLPTWVLDNPAGDEAESGQNFSSVSGKEISTLVSGGQITQALLQAISHQFAGSASLISYIQRLFPQGALPPPEDICQLDATIVEVPFEVEFWFWQQDLSPPTVPASLSVGSEHAIQGFFGEGVVVYQHDGIGWQQMQAYATLYNVPGGATTGKFFLQSTALMHEGITSLMQGSYWWRINDPNGFHVVGKLQAVPVSVDQNCLPWSLITISNHSNRNSGQQLWSYSHVQIVSTKGGIPPTHALFKPFKGMVMRSPFSALFWFYSKS